ncbi:MAG: DUF4493 domain-containing protein [Bacteroidaceae bacterium]|nr:DUF4493 domain-containing protein [Bacteroidaceae bacterium]
MKQRHIVIFTLLLMISLLASCVQEDGLSLANGKLHLSIGKISTQTGSRATPSELGKPLAEHFQLKVQRQGSQNTTYEGVFQDEISINVGTYDITATYGEDVIIGRDTPYYIGTAKATINKDESTTVSIPCKVGNALVSVAFGKNQDETARFDKFYEEYGLLVHIGNYSMGIDKEQTASSIYFPAGSQPQFYFYGTLKSDNGRMVSIELDHNDIPDVFQAADHAKLTLTLPDPESALGVNISKAEVTTVQLDETIPLSWLPVSTVIPTHQYNEDKMLVGTNLTFSNNYPGMEWKAVVTNANGETVRTVTGSGALFSEYKSSSDWPYLPAGKYKATYYLVKEDGENKVSSREFIVGQPTLTAKAEGYTSYDKYLSRDIDAANAADGYTLYEPQVSVNISPSLTANPRYNYQMTYTFNGETKTTTTNIQNIGNKKLDARLAAYQLSMNVQFAGEQVAANNDFYITGIPFMFAPPTTSTWEKDGDVTDDGDYARMGRWNGGSQSLTYTKVAIPTGTQLSLDYKFKPNAGAVSTTFTISAGNQTLVSGKANSYQNPTYEDVQSVTISPDATYIRCHNSYGAGATGTDLYRVGLQYR